MLNNRDDKYEAPEESEYHFSDEEVSYEVEPETTTKPAAPAGTTKPKIDLANIKNMMSRLTQSRRMMISLVVFLILIFAVYKMVSPTSVPVAPTVQPTTDATVPMAQQTPATTTTTTEVARPQQTPGVPASAYQIPEAPQLPVAKPAVQPPPTAPTTPTQASNIQQLPQVPVAPPAQQTAMPVTVNVPTPQTPAQPAPPTMEQQQIVAQQQTVQPLPPQQVQPVPQPQQPPPPVIATQPTISVSPGLPTAPTSTPTSTGSAAPTLGLQVPGGIDAKIANIASENERLMGQLRAESTQRLNEFSAQNKTLQDEVQSLNLRVATLEKEITQLIQVLTRQSQPQAAPTVTVKPARPQVQETRVPYTVQAIIPGRAWLRSDSGETVTVAEGDVIKDLGRVTKIDPYDGIVEVNTGNKLLSLSYGNGA